MHANRIEDFLFCLLTEFEFYIEGSAPRRPAWVGELTHMRSMCVGVSETGGEHRSPAKILKETFLLLALLSDQKRGKSQQGGLAPSSFRTSVRRARVSRASHAWQVCAAKDRAKIGSFVLPAISYYHACEHITRGSRADSCTHCLHAR